MAKEHLYAWQGRDRAGKPAQGELYAAGEHHAQSALRREGVQAVTLKRRRLLAGRAIRSRDIALFFRQLATMLQAGIALLQAFDILARSNTNPRLARLLTSLRLDVESGTALSSALRKHPLQFDRLACNLVEAGETAGKQQEMLDRLATWMAQREALKSRLRAALMYPTAVLVLAAAVLTLVMVFVIPSFAEVFRSFGSTLPAPTLAVMAVSAFLVAHGAPLLAGLVAVAVLATRAWRRSARLQQGTDRLLLRLPLVGSLVRQACVARWTRTLATLFAAGVPLLEALDPVGGATGNADFVDGTRRIRQDIATGASLATAMAASGLFPPMVLQMTAIGEASGALDHLLDKAADFHEAEVNDRLAGLSSLMEPAIIAFLGVLIGAIVVAMYLPIFQIGQVV